MTKSKYSLAHRLLHWSIAFALLFMLLTIFLRLTWMNRQQMAEIITGKLAELDVSITDREAGRIAGAIRKPMWEWHVYMGYVLIVLYTLRMLFLAVKGPVFTSPFAKTASAREKFQSFVYVLFYIFLALSLFSGMMIVWGPESYEHTFEELHELSLYWLLIYIIIHFSGLILAEMGNKKGIVNKMITGRDPSIEQ